MTLYRPVGLSELELIAALDFRAFPPRLPIQPIFYPVLNFDYAAHIAREWNTGDPVSGYAGFVTKWDIDDDYAARLKSKLWARAVTKSCGCPPSRWTNSTPTSAGQSKWWRRLSGQNSRAK